MNQLINRFYPTWLVYDVLAITPQQLKANNIKGILLDVDNTIVEWDSTTVPQPVKMWIDRLLKEDIGVVLLSNNRQKRIQVIAKQLNVSFVSSAKKPFKYGVLKGLALLNVPKEQVTIIGDQLFTDILVGTFVNVKTILVKSISHSDMLPTKIIRYVEKIALNRMKQKHQLHWRETIDK